MEWTRDCYTISDDPARLDRAMVHRFLSEESYWAGGVSREAVDRAIDHTMVFGVYRGPTQVGFARVVSDRARFAYLGDVFVVTSERGRGLGTWLVGVILAHPELRAVSGWLLATADAHRLYEKLGFAPISGDRAAMYMEYRRAPAGDPSAGGAAAGAGSAPTGG